MLGRWREQSADAAGTVSSPQKTLAPTELRTAPAPAVHKRLGDLLLEAHVITQEQLDAAINIQKGKGGFLGQILVQEGFVTQNQVASCLVKQCKIPHLNLMEYDISSEVMALIPQAVCEKYRLFPIDKLGRILTVAMVDPLDLEALEQVRGICPELRIKPILCNWEHFQSVYKKVYGAGKTTDGQQTITASSLGLSERPAKKPAPSPAPPAEETPAPAAEAPASAKLSIEDSLQGALTAIREEHAATAKAALEPSMGQESITLAIRESVLEALTQAQQQATAVPALSPESITAAIREGMQEMMAALRQNAAQPSDQSQAQVTQAILESVREAIQPVIGSSSATTDGVSAEMLREILEQTQQRQQQQEVRLAEIAEAILQTVQENQRVVESSVVNEGVRRDLGGRSNKHATVVPFQRWKRGQQTPESEVSIVRDEDTRILEALYGEQPLETLTFENYFPGAANEFTFKLGQAVAAQPGKEYNPFFLYGHVGIGKTHLISAIGNAILERDPSHRVGYVSASHFARRVMEAAREGALEAFRENYSHWDVLILDDIQFLGGRIEAQEEFFHIFNVLFQQSRQVIIASDKAPAKLGLLEQRLVSRFASGIVAELKAPEFETRVEILRHFLGQFAEPLRLPEEVVSLIAMRVQDDVRKMTGALRKVMAYAKLVGQDMSLEMASEILRHLDRQEDQ